MFRCSDEKQVGHFRKWIAVDASRAVGQDTGLQRVSVLVVLLQKPARLPTRIIQVNRKGRRVHPRYSEYYVWRNATDSADNIGANSPQLFGKQFVGMRELQKDATDGSIRRCAPKAERS